jgi:hypothetical protein
MYHHLEAPWVVLLDEDGVYTLFMNEMRWLLV